MGMGHLKGGERWADNVRVSKLFVYISTHSFMHETRVKSCVCLLNRGSGWRRARWQVVLSLIIVAVVVVIVSLLLRCDEAVGVEKKGAIKVPLAKTTATHDYVIKRVRARETISFDFAAIRDSWIQM